MPGEGPGATTGGPQVIGHERAGITFGTCNPEGMALKALREVVEKIGYKGLRAWRSLWNVTDLADVPTGEPRNTLGNTSVLPCWRRRTSMNCSAGWS